MALDLMAAMPTLMAGALSAFVGSYVIHLVSLRPCAVLLAVRHDNRVVEMHIKT
jgi:hypothetical protein